MAGCSVSQSEKRKEKGQGGRTKESRCIGGMEEGRGGRVSDDEHGVCVCACTSPPPCALHCELSSHCLKPAWLQIRLQLDQHLSIVFHPALLFSHQKNYKSFKFNNTHYIKMQKTNNISINMLIIKTRGKSTGKRNK